MRPLHLRQLTRRRPLLSNLVIHSRCPHRLPSALLTAPQRRHMHVPDFMARPQLARQDKPPGLAALQALEKHLDHKTGGSPRPEQIGGAFAALAAHVAKHPLEGDHTRLLQRAYTWLRALPDTPELPEALYTRVLGVLRGAGDVAFARTLWRDLGRAPGHVHSWPATFYYTRTLAAGGHADEALQVALARPLPWDRGMPYSIFDRILAGFVRAGSEKGVLDAMAHLERIFGAPPTYMYFHAVELYCQRDDVATAKTWYTRASADGAPPLQALKASLEASLKTGHVDWGMEIVADVLRYQETAARAPVDVNIWNAIARFTASVDPQHEKAREIVAMLWELSDQKHDNGKPKAAKPTPRLYEVLITVAIEQGNHALVDEYIAEMAAKGVTMYMTTRELELRSLAQRGNIEAAAEVFQDIKITHDTPKEYTGEAPQELLQTMCRCYPSCDLEKIDTIVHDLVAMNVLLNSSTLLAVLNVYLEEADFPGAKGLLNRHVGHFSAQERAATVELMMDFMHRPTASIEAAWDTYLVLARTFPELSVANREKAMNLFYELDKPLAAMRILEHMAESDDRRPTKYVYTAACTGIGHLAHVDSLNKAHRMISMDACVAVDTILRNAMLYAFTKCSLLGRAYFVYEEIARSPEGPDSNTISLVLDLCAAQRNGGLLRARRLWAQFRKMGFALTDANAAAFVGALAAHGAHADAWDAVRTQEADLGFAAGPLTLAALTTAAPLDRLEALEQWLVDTHPAAWALIRADVAAKMNVQLHADSALDYLFQKGAAPPFKTSLNLRGSVGYDAQRAVDDHQKWVADRRREQEAWETRRREEWAAYEEKRMKELEAWERQRKQQFLEAGVLEAGVEAAEAA